MALNTVITDVDIDSLLTATHRNNEIDFILDSGASRHLVTNKVPVVNINKLHFPVMIQVAKTKTKLLAHFEADLICVYKNGVQQEP